LFKGVEYLDTALSKESISDQDEADGLRITVFSLLGLFDEQFLRWMKDNHFIKDSVTRVGWEL
jgi:hypothetical protein